MLLDDVIESIPVLNDKPDMLVLADPQNYDKLFQAGEGPLEKMSVEYDHTLKYWSYIGGPPWNWMEEEANGIVDAIKEKSLKKVTKFKIKQFGRWIYILEHWNDSGASSSSGM